MKAEEFMQGTVYKNPQGEERRVLALGENRYGVNGFYTHNGNGYRHISPDFDGYIEQSTIVSQPYATPVKVFTQRKVYCWDICADNPKIGILIDIRENVKNCPYVVRFEDGAIGAFESIEYIRPKEPEITITEFMEKHGGKKFKESELLKLLENE